MPNAAEPPARPGANAPEFSVSELSSAIKRALEEGFGYVRLKGEVSGYRGPHASGHCYFALKDDKAKIEAVIWKGVFGRLRFKPEEGMEVIAQGKITTFPGSSKYQIMIEALEPAGAGALMALLEERKRKFAAEGLFDEGRKKQRPFLPKVVGVVTSPTGAVIRDMLHGFDERFPTHVIVWPVRVQGEGSAAEVAAAIRGFNALALGGPIPRPDLLIVARGGGSLEDLFGFNDEVVVRAAAESAIPLISAVGHETDWTLIDLVADARAPTPTKAAEWAVPNYADLVEGLDKFGLRHRIAMRRAVESARTSLRATARGLPKRDEIIAMPRQRFDAAAARLEQSLKGLVQGKTARFANVAGRMPPPFRLTQLPRQRFNAAEQRLSRSLMASAHRHSARLIRLSSRMTPAPLINRLGRARERLATLDARAGRALANRIAVRRRVLEGRGAVLVTLGHRSVLARGFALVRNVEGRMVRLAAAVTPGAELSIEFSDGRIGAQAGAATPKPKTPPEATEPTAALGKGKDRGGQGSLF
ncbi:MAG: exodeoxyribonuclease VII large subunit [Hyphomicrobium sp.]